MNIAESMRCQSEKLIFHNHKSRVAELRLCSAVIVLLSLITGLCADHRLVPAADGVTVLIDVSRAARVSRYGVMDDMAKNRGNQT